MADEKQNRNTRQKKLILQYLQKHQDTHVKAEDILSDLQKQEEKVGKTTIYRVLKALEAEGIIRKYTLNEKSPACYQYTGLQTACKHHYHLMCQQCGQLIHFHSELLEKMANDMREKAGFDVDESKTVFYGYCQECQRNLQRRE